MTARTPAQLEQDLASALAEIAPEADLGRLDRRRPLRDELDLDSMDFLRLVQALHVRTGVAIPEADYGKVRTWEALVGYLAGRS
jgi:acyl carrier protein